MAYGDFDHRGNLSVMFSMILGRFSFFLPQALLKILTLTELHQLEIHILCINRPFSFHVAKLRLLLANSTEESSIAERSGPVHLEINMLN